MSGDCTATTADEAWKTLVAAARDWAEHHMDQWEKFKFDTSCGTIYVRIAMEDEYPDSYDRVNS